MADLADYDYALPEELIANAPADPRDSCRMLVYDRASGETKHRIFRDIVDELRPGDVIVINETRVIPARLAAVKATGAKIEVFLLKKLTLATYEALLKPLRRVRPGDVLLVKGKLAVTVVSKDPVAGTAEVRLAGVDGEKNIETLLEQFGEMPLPHYIKNGRATKENYNTVYARVDGSAAAPTAGLHWTPDLMAQVKAKGVIFAPVTLDVGLGTFRPVKEQDFTKHVMHTERYTIPADTAAVINAALRDGRRIIATGTTSLRTLEGCWQKYGRICAVTDETDIFIYPPYQFQVVSGLITNFHLPKSTLLMLVAAFIGREKVLSLYEDAKKLGYRFYSFGDCLLLC